MTIKKKALGKITKVEKIQPKKRKLTDDEKAYRRRYVSEFGNDLLEGTDLDDTYYDPGDDVDMAVE